MLELFDTHAHFGAEDDVTALCARVAAIGETGLDAHYASETLTAQADLFARHLELADEFGLPVVVHTARRLARERHTPEDAFAALTTANARALFLPSERT